MPAVHGVGPGTDAGSPPGTGTSRASRYQSSRTGSSSCPGGLPGAARAVAAPGPAGRARATFMRGLVRDRHVRLESMMDELAHELRWTPSTAAAHEPVVRPGHPPVRSPHGLASATSSAPGVRLSRRTPPRAPAGRRAADRAGPWRPRCTTTTARRPARHGQRRRYAVVSSATVTWAPHVHGDDAAAADALGLRSAGHVPLVTRRCRARRCTPARDTRSVGSGCSRRAPACGTASCAPPVVDTRTAARAEARPVSVRDGRSRRRAASAGYLTGRSGPARPRQQ